MRGDSILGRESVVALALILAFVGGKMFIHPWVHVPIVLSLGIIAFVLTATIVSSLLWRPTKTSDA